MIYQHYRAYDSAVWKRKPRRLRHFIILSQPLDEMDVVQTNMTRNGYYPDCWQVFSRNKTTMVLSIWRKGFGIKYQIQQGDMLDEMTTYMAKSGLNPVMFASKPRKFSRENKSYWIVWRGKEFSWKNEQIPKVYETFSRDWDDVESLIESHMRKYELPSINIFVSKSGHTLLSAAYGYSDLLNKKRASPNNRYRIASISKTLTAMAIANLISQGKLSMRTLVFGKRGILNTFEVHPFLQQITVSHLLEHSSGGWSHLLQREFDRMETSQMEFLEFLIKSYVPIYVPGQVFVYSNIGYVFLGRIIEKVSGESYEDFVRHNLLWPLNIDARVGGSISGKDEVMYYSHDNANPYDHWNPSLLDSAAGWVFQAEDLAKLYKHLESGRNAEHVILALRNRLSAGHGLGIQIDSTGALYHLGSLTGVEAIAYTHNDLQVIIFTNERDRQHNVHTGWMLLLSQHISRIVDLGLI
ncbi:unnamed protein product [Auanema sp. JU1783]|nr:unnamed protein product [Auanema sp. JU1783]